MIEAFKSEEVVDKFGGRFRLTAVIQRRLVQLHPCLLRCGDYVHARGFTAAMTGAAAG